MLSGVAAPAAGGSQNGDEHTDFVCGRITVLDPDVRNGLFWGFVNAHSGMFPCFLGGRLSRLVLSARNARVTFIRVLLGLMTVSIYPRSAAI